MVAAVATAGGAATVELPCSRWNCHGGTAVVAERATIAAVVTAGRAAIAVVATAGRATIAAMATAGGAATVELLWQQKKLL